MKEPSIVWLVATALHSAATVYLFLQAYKWRLRALIAAKAADRAAWALDAVAKHEDVRALYLKNFKDLTFTTEGVPQIPVPKEKLS